MKIFFIIHALNKGGAQRVMINLANSFAKLGHDIGIITLKSKKLDSYPLSPLVKRFELNLEGNNTTGIKKFIINYKRLFMLRQILKNEKPDAVIAFMEISIVLSILASIGLPSKIFGSERNYPPDKKSVNVFWKLLRKLVFRFATGHITQTSQIKNWLNNFTGARNIAIIPNPIVMPIPRTEPYIYPSTILPFNRKFILAVGVKTKQKGFDILIDVFSKLSKSHPKWDLIIVGIDQIEDKKKNKYESILYLTKKLNITNRVHFPGRVGNIEDWYKVADLFILSSRYEGFPNVLLEAMACGCPSIAFDCNTGPRDIINNNINGLLIPSQNSDKLRIAINKLIIDKNLRKKISLAALSVKNRFSINFVTKKWLGYLQKNLD